MEERDGGIRRAMENVTGAYTPGSQRETRHTVNWLIGLSSLAAAWGLCYAILRTYEKRLGQYVDHAMTERLQKKRDGSAPVVARSPSDRAAVREATGSPVPAGASKVGEMHEAATSTAGGSL